MEAKLFCYFFDANTQWSLTNQMLAIGVELVVLLQLRGILLNRTLDCHRPLTRYVKLQDAHAPGMPGTFSPPPRVSDPDMHHDTCVTHVPWCMPGSLIGGFLWRRWQRKRSRHSRRMSNPQFFCVSGKRSMERLMCNIYGDWIVDTMWHHGVVPTNQSAPGPDFIIAVRWTTRKCLRPPAYNHQHAKIGLIQAFKRNHFRVLSR